MILVFSKGRLGNQIFQYMFLKTVGKGHFCIVFGFNELKEVFEIDDILAIDKNRKWKIKLIDRFLKPCLEYLTSRKIISSIEVDLETLPGGFKRESTSFTKTKGVFRRIVYLKYGYFQSDAFFANEFAKKLTIKNKYHDLAEEFLTQCPPGSFRVFVHIRMGDYRTHTTIGKSVQLPIKYYREQIEYFSNTRKNCFFIFLSDEPDYIEREFKALDKKLVSHNQHYGTDLAIMTKCHGAILSPSSFGWWGAFLMENRDLVVAPRFWLGFNTGMDYHSQPLPDFIKKIEV